jgi:hypothetical protein
MQRFSRPIVISADSAEIPVETVTQARDVLMSGWPAERGPRHRDALDACLKVIDGHRSTQDAETAFREAAVEAGLLRSV